MNSKISRVFSVLALVSLLLVLAGCEEGTPWDIGIGGEPADEEMPAARSTYQCAVHTEQGCAKLVVESGGEIEVQSGGTVDFQDGVTVDLSSGVDLDGSTLTWDADGDTTAVASDDDVVSMTVGASTGYFNVLTGNLKVGDGSPDTSLNGEDLYVEGTIEVDGAADFDGAVDMASTLNLLGALSDSGGALTFEDNTLIDGQSDAVQLTIQGHTTQTSSSFVVEQSDGTDKFTINDFGQVTISPEMDDDGANYDTWVGIDGTVTGTGTKDRVRALEVEFERPAGQELTSGDHDDVGIKVAVKTKAITTTTGTVLRGIDCEAKADNPSGTVTNLYGGLFTSKSDTGAGDVSEMIALSSNVHNNAAVNTTLLSADFRLYRQAATEPTTEGVVRVRNGSTSGTGCDYGVGIVSDGSGETDDFDYGLDMSGADIDDADIRFSNGTTLYETTDTVLTFGEFLAAEEQSAVTLGDGETITATGTFQPITSSGNVTCSTSTCIVDGVVDGQLLILQNVGSDNIVIDGTGGNVECKNDVTLDDNDTLMLLWNGSDWFCIANYDNS